MSNMLVAGSAYVEYLTVKSPEKEVSKNGTFIKLKRIMMQSSAKICFGSIFALLKEFFSAV
ncbi:unnamed protein product [marine sediment metagenome]|uniref:Uncharacterized protein n=1 Tax=marine sediment metagenome TaxID=412755 RepID=X1JFY5_9ZZZZ